MKADRSKMFPLKIESLAAEQGVAFPLYLFFRRCNRFIAIRNPGDPIGLKKYNALILANHYELWVPSKFKKQTEIARYQLAQASR